LCGPMVIHHHDGVSWENQKEKYEEHCRLAETQDLSNPRNMFYYAQSLRAAGRNYDAITVYNRRAGLTTGWKQEAVYAKLMAARIAQSLGEEDRAICDYLATYQMDPTRNEALYALIALYRQKEKYDLGYLFATIIADRGMPSIGEKLFLEQAAWGGNMMLEAGLCAYYSGHKPDALFWWTIALDDKELPLETVEVIKKNLAYVEDV
jgi:hypothetical protein